MDKCPRIIMKFTQEFKLFFCFLIFVIIAEVVTSLVDAMYGLFLHSMILFSLITLSAVRQKSVSNLYLCLSIAPLIRIFSLSLPLYYLPVYSWYIIAGLLMFLAATVVIRIQGLTLTDVGINFNQRKTQFLIMLTGVPFGILEYEILKPALIATDLTVVSWIALAFAFFIATGFVEELVFRGVIQNNVVNNFGVKTGIIAVSVLFAALHIGWLNVWDVLLVFFISAFFGIFAYKTSKYSWCQLVSWDN